MGVYCTISTLVRVVVVAFVLGVAAGAFTVARAGKVPEAAPPSSELVLGSEEVCCGEPLDHLPAHVAAGAVTA